MRLTEDQRALCAERVAALMLDAIEAGIADTFRHAAGDDEDAAAIGAAAAVAVAMSLAATRCYDAAAAVSLVRTLAEGVAVDIYAAP